MLCGIAPKKRKRKEKEIRVSALTVTLKLKAYHFAKAPSLRQLPGNQLTGKEEEEGKGARGMCTEGVCRLTFLDFLISVTYRGYPSPVL